MSTFARRLFLVIGALLSAFPVIGAPDLILKSFTVDASGAAGSNVNFSLSIINQGTATANFSTAEMRLSTSSVAPSSSDPLLLSMFVGDLAPGSTLNSSGTTMPIPANLSAGNYYVWMSLDVDGTAGQGDANQANDRTKMSFTVTGAPATIPSAPQNLGASAGDAQNSLSWSASSSNGGATITNYRVFRGTNSSNRLIVTSGGCANLTAVFSCTDTGLTNGQSYNYIVSAVNSVGQGAPSNSAIATPTAAATIPTAPQNLSAAAGDAQSSLSWSAPSTNGGATITNYRVFRGTNSSNRLIVTSGGCANLGAVFACTDTGLINGQSYDYIVSAVNGIGQGAPSNSAIATPTATATIPSAPQNLGAAAGDGQSSLSWSAPSTNGGATITNYRVFRGTNSSNRLIVTSGGCANLGAVFICTDTGLTNGQSYDDIVSAVNSVGQGAPSNSATVTPTATATIPGAPQNLGASAGDTQNNLSWSAPSSNGGATITNYRVFRGTNSANRFIVTSGGCANLGAVFSCTDTGLINGQSYDYIVSAVNVIGQGAPSNSSIATPTSTATIPGAPQNLGASPGDTQNSLAWSTPTSNGGATITNYRVFRGTNSANRLIVTNGGCANLGAVFSCTDTGLTNGQLYDYIVSAVNTAGQGAPSNSATATPTAAATMPAADFIWSPVSPKAGQPVQFTDTSSGSPTSWLWSFGDGASSTSQHPTHTYVSSTSYSVNLVVSNTAGVNSVTKNVPILSADVPAPVVTAFTANPSSLSAGQSSTLSWSTTNATTVSISGVPGTQQANGSLSVSPTATTTYTLTATGSGGTATKTTTIALNTTTGTLDHLRFRFVSNARRRAAGARSPDSDTIFIAGATPEDRFRGDVQATIDDEPFPNIDITDGGLLLSGAPSGISLEEWLPHGGAARVSITNGDASHLGVTLSRSSTAITIAAQSTSVLQGEVGVFRKMPVRLEILQNQGASTIDPNVPTWVVIHGRTNSSETQQIQGIAMAIKAKRPRDQVLLLDWSSAAAEDDGENWIGAVGSWAGSHLAEYGFHGSALHLVGHSWGTYVADKLAQEFPDGVDLIVALDPAANDPRYGEFNPNDEGAIDFSAHSKFSLAFHSSDALGNEKTPTTATEAFSVGFFKPIFDVGEVDRHDWVRDLFTSMVLGNGGVSQLFSLERLLSHDPGPWLLNKYQANDAYGPTFPLPKLYEGVIVSGPTSRAPKDIRYFDKGGVEQTLSEETLSLRIASVLPTTSQTLAQGTSITYMVTVVKETGAPVSGATISVTDYLKNQTLLTQPTDGAGVTNYTTTVPASAAAGTYNLTFSATLPGYTSSTQVVRSVTVFGLVAPKLSITSVTPTTAQTLIAGQSVTYTITVVGSSGPVSDVAVTGFDYLKGLSFLTAPTNGNGVTSYTTTVSAGTAAGTYTIGFTASLTGYTSSTSLSRQVNVTAPATQSLSITTAAFSPATANVGVGYVAQAAVATGGLKPYIWSANSLPNGLTINTTSGVMSGTPTAAGTFNVAVTVKDNGSPQQSFSKVLSITVNAAPIETTVPSAPQPLQAQPGNSQNFLGWTAPSSNGGSPVTSYRVSRGTNTSNETLVTSGGCANLATALTCTDTGLTNGQTYYYFVNAVNSAGQGPASNVVNATPKGATLPGAPTLQASPGDGQNFLGWTAPSSDGGSAITNYKVFRGTSSSSNQTLITSGGCANLGSTLACTDSGLTNGQIYYYTVSAVTSAGQGAASNVVNATPTGPTLPGAPALQASPGNGQNFLGWTAPASNGGSAITNYKVFRGTSSSNQTLITSGGCANLGAVLACTDSGLTNGQIYYYTVSAVTSAGQGAASNAVNSTPTGPALPGAPQTLQASPGNGQNFLGWQAPASNGGSAITSYKVFRGTNSSNETLVTSGGCANLGMVLACTDTGLTNGQIYYYFVSAVTSAGQGLASNVVNSTPTGPTLPGAPQTLQASPGNGQNFLGWQAPAFNGGSGITSYKVFRGTNSSNETLVTSGGCANLGTVLACTDTGLTNGQIYYYFVSAVTSAGQGPASNVVNSTPTGPTLPGAPTLQAQAGNSQNFLGWQPPSSNGGSAITSYKVFRGTNSSNETLVTSGGCANLGTVLACTDTGLIHGQIYYYFVSAVNGIGQGPGSNVVTATP